MGVDEQQADGGERTAGGQRLEQQRPVAPVGDQRQHDDERGQLHRDGEREEDGRRPGAPPSIEQEGGDGETGDHHVRLPLAEVEQDRIRRGEQQRSERGGLPAAPTRQKHSQRQREQQRRQRQREPHGARRVVVQTRELTEQRKDRGRVDEPRDRFRARDGEGAGSIDERLVGIEAGAPVVAPGVVLVEVELGLPRVVGPGGRKPVDGKEDGGGEEESGDQRPPPPASSCPSCGRRCDHASGRVYTAGWANRRASERTWSAASRWVSASGVRGRRGRYGRSGLLGRLARLPLQAPQSDEARHERRQRA